MNITLIQKTTMQVIKNFHYAALILKGLADTHMPRYLLLGITCFVIAGNNISLLADSTHENIVTEKMAHQDDYISILEKKIQDLIIHGHSVDEIMAILGDSHGHFRNNQELIIKIYKLLNEQNLKNNNGITILINNKESEEFYAQMNSLTRMKKRILILKIIIATGITAGILYLLYRLLKTNQSTNEDVNEEENDTFLNHEDLNVVRMEGQQEGLTITQEASNDRHEQQENISAEHYHVNVINSGQASLLTELRNSVIQQLRESVIQQTEYLRSIGLEPVTALPAYTPITDNPIFTMRLTEQFAHGEDLGLLVKPRVQFIQGHRVFFIPNDDDNFSHIVTMNIGHLDTLRRDYISS